MVASVIAWDIETVPDLKGFAAANGHDGKSDGEIRASSFRSTSTTRSFASARWSPIRKMTGGLWMCWARRALPSNPKRS